YVVLFAKGGRTEKGTSVRPNRSAAEEGGQLILGHLAVLVLVGRLQSGSGILLCRSRIGGFAFRRHFLCFQVGNPLLELSRRQCSGPVLVIFRETGFHQRRNRAAGRRSGRGRVAGRCGRTRALSRRSCRGGRRCDQSAAGRGRVGGGSGRRIG